MRPLVFAALAFIGGLSLAIIALSPGEGSAAFEDIDLASDEGAPSGPLSAREARRGIDAPEWRMGEGWRVSFAGNDPVCWVVVANVTDDYRQGVACPGDDRLVAANIAATGQGWIGSFTKDLEGVYGDERIRFYDWPLTDGKRWTTTWFGERMEVLAVYDVIDGPHGSEPGYELTMYLEGDPFASYDYVPSLKWWSGIEFHFSEYVFEIHERDVSYQGQVSYGDAVQRLDWTATALGPPSSSTFAVPEEDDILVLMAQRSSPAAGLFALRDPSGQVPYMDAGTTMLGGTILDLSYRNFRIAYVQAAPGQWTVASSHAGIGNAYVDVWGVAITDVRL